MTLTVVAPSLRTPLRVDAWEDYASATRGERFAWWAETHLRQAVGQFAGRPLVLEEDWQLPVFLEALATNDDDTPYWQIVLLVIQRKNAKTTSLAGYGLFELDEGEGQPEVLFAGSSDRQSGRLFDTAMRFIAASPSYLSSRFIVRQHVGEIERVDGGAAAYRIATTNADAQHGWNPSLAVLDELHAWRSPSLREAFNALTTADGARASSQVFAITTAGESSTRRTSILGKLIDGNRLLGETERLRGVTITRNHESRTLVVEFHAADAIAADPRPLRVVTAELNEAMRTLGASSPVVKEKRRRKDELARRLLESVRPANPASWISDDDLMKKAAGPLPDAGAFLRLHAGIWADSEHAFVSDARWAELGDGSPLEAGRRASLGIDGSRNHDCTVVAWASRADDGRVDVGCHVMAARGDAPHHELHPAGEIDYDRVRGAIVDALTRYRVADAAYDPRYLDSTAQDLRRRLGARIVPVDPWSRQMVDAVAALERGVIDGVVRHDGDAVLAAHVAMTKADRSRRIRLYKEDPSNEWIDATVAVALAYWRATLSTSKRSALY